MTDKQKQPVYVEIHRFDGEDAYCRAIYRNRLLPITLNRKSLEDCDLREGEHFNWRPRLDGVVKIEDVTDHPRRLSPEQIADGRKAAEELRANWNPEHW
jgi:hypothetical protein